jgi:hypothetical protein
MTIFSQTPESSHFGIFGAYAQEYNYFKIQMGFNDTQYWNWVDGHFSNLGAHWTRSNAQLIWDLIEPNLDGNYNWDIFTKPDSVITNIYNGSAQVEWLGVIRFDISTHNPLNYPTQWQNFLQEVVDRYNGDGLNDLNSFVKVKHWQIGNEIFEYINAGFTSSQYAQVVALADTAIRSLDPNAKICLVAPTAGDIVNTYLVNTIITLSTLDVSFEIIDLHHWGPANLYKMSAIPIYRNILNENGYANVKIWSCENGTWAYQPLSYPYQTQEEQAASLIKRYVWNFANGLDKLMWNNLMEWYMFAGSSTTIFNSLGLIGDGQLNGEPPNELNFKRKSYYSYKLLASVIDSYYATFVSNNLFHNEAIGNYGYTYLDNVTSENFDISWTDNDYATYNFTIASDFLLSEMVPYDTSGNFNTQNFASGTHSITIYKNQVYLLKKSSTSNIQNSEIQDYSFTIYPNPFSNEFIIETIGKNERLNYEIFNAKGQVVFKGYLFEKTTVHTSNFTSGFYIIRLKNGKSFEYRKVIKE